MDLNFLETLNLLEKFYTEDETKKLTPEEAKEELDKLEAELAALKEQNKGISYKDLSAETKEALSNYYRSISILKDYLYTFKTNIIADEEDWERFLEISNNFPTTLHFEDLDIPIKVEGGEPIPDGQPMWAPISYTEDSFGTLNEYDVDIDSLPIWDRQEELKVLVAKYLGKPVEEVSKEELFSINENKLAEFLANEDIIIKEATDYIKELIENDDIDYDQVEWED